MDSVELNTRDDVGLTALDWASLKRHEDMMSCLRSFIKVEPESNRVALTSLDLQLCDDHVLKARLMVKKILDKR